MTAILMLIFLVWFLVIDNFIITPMFRTTKKKTEGTYITTPGFEMLGALAQDGGELINGKQGEGKQTRS